MGITVLAVPHAMASRTAEDEASALQGKLGAAGIADGRLVQLIPSRVEENWLLAVFQSEEPIP
jgi:hypothetical protein